MINSSISKLLLFFWHLNKPKNKNTALKGLTASVGKQEHVTGSDGRQVTR